jgi:hypothetical protein
MAGEGSGAYGRSLRGTFIFEALLWWTLMDWGRLFSKHLCGGLWWTGASLFGASLWWTPVDWELLFEALLWWTLVAWGLPFLSPPVVFMTNWHQQKVDAGGVGSSLSKPSCGIYAQLASRQGGRWWTGESLCQASPWWAGEALFEAPPWWTLVDSGGLWWTLVGSVGLPFLSPPYGGLGGPVSSRLALYNTI